MELISRLTDESVVQSLSAGDKVLSGLMVAFIGMLITFLALIFLWGAIIVMTKIFDTREKSKQANSVAEPVKAATASSTQKQEDDGALIAVISAAIAASLSTSIDNIVVKKIERIPDQKTAWSRSGLAEQINNRF